MKPPKQPQPIPGPERQPWKPPAYTVAQAAAIRALAQGQATAEQQVEALKFIVEDVCGLYDLEFRPGSDGVRDSAFAGGKRFVGLQIVKLVKIIVRDRSKPNEQPD